MKVAGLTRSFGAGEISPELFGRIDLTKFQTGLKTCRNFQVLPHGPVVNSPGWDYILETKDSTKKSVVIPFIFNTAQAYQLEFGNQYIRFHTQAGTVLEAATAITLITNGNPGVVTQNAHGYNNGDWVFITGVGGMTQINNRFFKIKNKTANTYELTYFDNVNINTTAYGAYTAGGTGARVYEIASPYLEADLPNLNYTQSADVLTITHPSYDKQELKRLGATNWTLTPIVIAQPALPANARVETFASGPGGGTPVLLEYKVAFIDEATQKEGVAYRPRTNYADNGAPPVTIGIVTITNANPGVVQVAGAVAFAPSEPVFLTIFGLNGYFERAIVAVNTVIDATHFTVKDLFTGVPIDTTGFSIASPAGGTMNSFRGVITAMTNANPGVFTTALAHGLVAGDPVAIEGVIGVGGSLNNYIGVINSAPSPTTFTLKDEVTGVILNTTAMGAYTAGGLARLLGVKLDLTVAGNSVSLAFDTPFPATTSTTKANVYKKVNGLYGFIGQTGIAAPNNSQRLIDKNITPDFTFTPSIANDPISTANNFPGAVGYWQGRRLFAGSNNNPQTLYATRSGTESDMTYRIPSQDDDSITVRLKARRADTIRHLVPLTDLVILTSGSEWKIPGSTPMTPSNVTFNPEDYIGASPVVPVVTSGSVVYAQDRGGHLRELKFIWQQQGYQSSDLSVLAPNLFDQFSIVSMAYTRAPYPFVWAVRSDGLLLGLTYMPEQQVAAWHKRDTQGTFESVCATPEGPEDVLYAIIKRTINGRTVRYFERQRSRNFGGVLANAYFVDAGLTYNGAPTVNVAGFYHLEGSPVSCLADGVVIPGRTIVNGSISPALSTAASVVSAGLAYTSDIETLPLALESIPAGGLGSMKNVDEVVLRVLSSSDVFVGPDFNNLTEQKQRTTEPYGSPPAMTTGVVRIKPSPNWNEDGGVVIRQPNPLPMEILSMTLKVSIGG